MINRIQNLYIWLKSNIAYVTAIFVLQWLILEIIISQVCIVLTTSNSVPYKICLQLYNVKPKKGDLCAFIYKGEKFIKYLSGQAGDRITNSNDEIFIGHNRVGKAYSTCKLTPIKAQTVPKGYVFVSGNHTYSFDSRYQEFGFIKDEDIQGKVIGLVKY